MEHSRDLFTDISEACYAEETVYFIFKSLILRGFIVSAITPAKYSVETKKLSLQWAPFLENFSRRTLDILASGFGLLFLSPFFLLVAIILRRDSPGPIFYRGSRAGKNGSEFGIYKFRTMYEHPASYEGPCVTSSDDGRITPFGRWLRDTKINELPQLWNVLVGEMSLVGPRPEDFKIASEWPEDIRNEILSVRPGVTSPASIIFREEEKLLSSNNLMEDYLKKILPSKAAPGSPLRQAEISFERPGCHLPDIYCIITATPQKIDP